MTNLIIKELGIKYLKKIHEIETVEEINELVGKINDLEVAQYIIKVLIAESNIAAEFM